MKGYLLRAWPIVEPAREFTPGWHIDAICEHLEAVSKGQISRLLINVPPGMMKSLTTNVFWPTWEWGPKKRADLRYVSFAYSQDLTVRDNRRSRILVSSDWYRRLFPHVKLTSDQNAKVRFDTSEMGFRIATSVSGLGTGERGDRVIVDDPHNVKEGESDVVRESTLLWFTESLPTRLNDPRSSVILVIMQRVHEYDVSGYILAKELGYEHLMLPMEFEPERKCTTVIGFKDPRTEDSELIWKERMPRTVVERDKKVLGEYATAGQFQQRPAPRGGGMFKKDWFEIVDTHEPVVRWVRGWDLAATEDKLYAAFTASVKMGVTRSGQYVIKEVFREKMSVEKVEKAIVNTASQDGYTVVIAIPQDPGQAGKAQKKYLSTKLAGYTFKFEPETGSKETRAAPLASQAEAGNVKLIRGHWNSAFLEELTKFPSGQWKDQVDAAAKAFNTLTGRGKKHVPSAPMIIELESAHVPEEIGYVNY